MPSALQIIREQLPQFFKETQAEDMVNTAKLADEFLLPQEPMDFALMGMLGPFAKPIKAISGALAGMSYAPEAESSQNAGLSFDTPVWDYLRKLGVPESSLGMRQEEYARERERGYIPREAMNAESRPWDYMPYGPDKVEPYKEWLYNPKSWGGENGGYHNFLEGIVIPERHPRFPLFETLTHEGQHVRPAALPSEDILGNNRRSAMGSVLNKFKDYIDSYHQQERTYPDGVSGQRDSDELAPQLMAHESYLRAGSPLTRSPLGRAVLETPEEKLWWMSRRYPRPKVNGEFLDAMTGASPE